MRTCDSNLSWKQADLPPFLLRGHSKPGNAKPTGPPMAWQEHHVWPACLVSYQDVMQASAVEKEAWAGMQGEGHFLHATESNYAKGELLSDKDKREDKGKRLTPLYRGGGLLLLLQSDTVVPSAHMMNESPCNRSSCLCNKQKGILCTLTTSALFLHYWNQWEILFHQLTGAGNNLQMPLTAANTITYIVGIALKQLYLIVRQSNDRKTSAIYTFNVITATPLPYPCYFKYCYWVCILCNFYFYL